jgi:thiol-disulfide isomerase/thioredoxin
MFCKGEDTIMATYNNRDSLEIFHKYFIKKNPDAYASSIAILFNASSWNADTLAHYLSILSPVIRNFKYGKFSDEILTRKKNNEVGSPMQQITALDWLGNSFASSQLSGKLVLLEFWASWCEPCRKSFPELQ